MIGVKCVKQSHRCTELNDLMREFRFMVNEAIRIGIEKNITSKLTLRNGLYPRFKNEFHTSYISMAVFKAHALLKSYRKTIKKNHNGKIPRVKPDKLFLIVDSNCYKIFYDHIQIPTRPREFVIIPLNQYVSRTLADQTFKRGNVTITPNHLSISFSKEVQTKEPTGYMGIDMNLENATGTDDKGQVDIIYMSHIVSMKMKYREILSHFTRNDTRIQKKLKNKYSMKQRNREDTFLHQKSKEIISSGKQIILEDLKGIRKLYKKGNGQGTRFRFRLNSWSRFKLQQMINYKSIWQNGFPVIFVNPKGTSSKCSRCEAKALEENRNVRCPRCGLHIDRDVNASRNILNRGIRSMPDGLANEAMVQESGTPVILKVDARQLIYRSLIS
ncbi:MAG: RNA-guided endonuclease InsQ/TnpB family protein [Nitrosotalea sp.]